MSKSIQPGWQQPAQCSHLGLLFAAFSINLHAEGHEWICTCGQRFVVVSNGGDSKRFVRGRTGGI